MKYAFAVIIAGVFCSSASFAADENHGTAAHGTAAGSEFHTEMQQAMEKMHRDMKDMKMTGDVDVDFSQMMIIHHKGALEMAALQIKYGKNSTLKTFNEKIIKDQTKEIQDLQTFAQQKQTR